MQDISEFAFLTLNATTMYQISAATGCKKILQSFYNYLHTNNPDLATHLQFLVATLPVNHAVTISRQLQGLSVGNIRLFQKTHTTYSGSQLVFYKFKKETENTLSLILYYLGENPESANTDNLYARQMTHLPSSENGDVIKHTFSLGQNQTDDELTRLLHMICSTTGDTRYQEDAHLGNGLAFLNPTLAVSREEYDSELLQGQTFFIRTFYRLLEDCVPAEQKLQLEQGLLSFVTDNLLNRAEGLQQSHPELYKIAVLTHIAYFQYTRCIEDVKKREITGLLQGMLASSPVGRPFTLPNKLEEKLQASTLERDYNRDPFRSAHNQSSQRTGQLSDIQPILTNILYLERHPINNPLQEAEQFCRILSQSGTQYPLIWTLLSVENFILKCPLPTATISSSPDSGFGMPRKYSSMSPLDWKAFGTHLEVIADHYLKAVELYLKNRQTPKVWIILSSIIFLRAYCHQNESGAYSILPATQILLGNLLPQMKLLPHMATYHPDFDTQWVSLCELNPPTRSKYITSELTICYTAVLQTSPNYSALQADTAAENKKRMGMGDKKSEMAHYWSEGQQQKYPDITAKFNQALQLELFLKRCFCVLTLQDTSYLRNTFSFSYNSLSTPLTSVPGSLQSSMVNSPNFVIASKEINPTDSVTSIALRRSWMLAIENKRPYTSNTLQIAPQYGAENARNMDAKDIQLRQLLQLTLKDNPIPLVLDRYHNKINDLSSDEIQYYTLENLLSGSALLPYLQQAPLFLPYLQHFDAFIEKGLKQFENHSHQLTQPSLFFIKLSLRLNTYIAFAMHEDRDERLQKLAHRLQDWIRIHHSRHDICAGLQQMLLATLLTLKQLSPSNDEHFELAFIAFGYTRIHSNAEKTLSLIEEIEQDTIDYHFQTWSQQLFAHRVTPDLILRLANQIDLPIEPSDSIIISSPDQIVIKRAEQPLFFFNARRCVFLNEEGLVYTSVAGPLRNHRIFSYLNQSPDYCFCNADQSIVVLAHDPKETRLEFLGEAIAVYQSLEITGQKERYELHPLRAVTESGITFQRQQLRIKTMSHNHSIEPYYYFSEHLRCWVSTEQQKAYILQEDNIVYTVTPERISYHDKNDTDTLYIHCSGKQSYINPFEQPQYCHIHINPLTSSGHMHLIRYPDLRFEVDNQGQLYFNYHETSYKQILRGTSLFTPAAKVSHLLFQHPEELETIALLTVQKFSQDNPVNNYRIKSNHADRAAGASLRAIVYQVDNTTQLLSSHNASDSLYLAYVYAATYDYDKAIATLNDLNLVELQTNQEELNTLTWFMQLNDGVPKYLTACKLKAVSLYIRCIQEKFSSKINGKADLLRLLPALAQCYSEYVKHIPYLPSSHLLDEIAVQSLMKFFQNQAVTIPARKIISRTIDQETPYTHLYDIEREFPADLLAEPCGSISIEAALTAMNSSFKETDFRKYLAVFIKMSQDASYKASVVQFCQNFLRLRSFCKPAKLLLYLCAQTIDLTPGTLSPLSIKTSTNVSFSYDFVNWVTTETPFENPIIAAVATSRLPLAPRLAPLTLMTNLINSQYPAFYAAYQQLDSSHPEDLSEDMTEQALGDMKLHYLERKLHLIRSTFASSEERDKLLLMLQTTQQDLDLKLKQHWQIALEIANRPIIEHRYYLLQAGHYGLLTANDLMTCYASGTADIYTAMTTLSDERTIADLHEHVHEAMLASLQFQQFQRLITELTNIQTHGAMIRWSKLLDLMLREHVPALNERTDMIYLEVSKNIMIRPDQKEMSDALQRSSRIIDATMGSGKTSVVIPMRIAEIPENTIFVIVVLRALLKTTHAYLHKLGSKINQVPYLFDFHRNDDSTPHDLEIKKRLFQDLAFRNNPLKPHFLVTAADSIQSLALKYFELVYVKQYKEYEKQILALQPMLLLLLRNGINLTDEIHEIQDDYKSPVRYALDKPMPIALDLVQDVVGLYEFRDEHPFTANAEFVANLLELPDSPIRNHLKKCCKNNPNITEQAIKEAITNFLLKKGKLHFNILPRFRKYLERVHTQIRLFQYVKHVFYKKQYGPSKRKDLTPIERSLSIPYFKNEKPKENSHFEDPQEYIVYTIEGLLQEFPLDVFEQLIGNWINQAGIELQNSADQFHSFEETPAQSAFSICLAMHYILIFLKIKNLLAEFGRTFCLTESCVMTFRIRYFTND